jgi:citrate lyase subunit beta/citryl-CoA lyase
MSVRTVLFVPGNRPDRFDNAVASGADAIVIDLEDAVPASEKPSAREAACTWLRKPVESGGPLRLLRVNARGTPWFDDDVSALRDTRVQGVMLPKCERASDLESLLDVGVWPLIESARGLHNAVEIGSAPGVQRLVFGGLDLQVDLGMDADADETELAPYRAQVVLASRLANLGAPIDGVTPEINDADLLTRATRRAMRQGFGGKLCIHPRQVPVVHAAMHPGDDAVAYARRVLEAAEASDGGAVALDGKMIDRPVILRAQAVLARAERTK